MSEKKEKPEEIVCLFKRISHVGFYLALVCFTPLIVNIFVDIPAWVAWTMITLVGLGAAVIWVMFAFMSGITALNRVKGDGRGNFGQ